MLQDGVRLPVTNDDLLLQNLHNDETNLVEVTRSLRVGNKDGQ